MLFFAFTSCDVLFIIVPLKYKCFVKNHITDYQKKHTVQIKEYLQQQNEQLKWDKKSPNQNNVFDMICFSLCYTLWYALKKKKNLFFMLFDKILIPFKKRIRVLSKSTSPTIKRKFVLLLPQS